MGNKRELIKYRGTICLNCEQDLDVSEKYCHNCGQLNSTKKLTFEDFFEEYFSGIIAYDSRISRTLSALLFHPGKISRDYIEGKRQRYANPYKFYLSVSIIFFLTWGFLGGNEERPLVQTGSQEESAQASPEEEVGFYNTILPKNELGKIYTPEWELDTLETLDRIQKKWLIFKAKFDESGITVPRVALEELKYTPSSINRWLYNKVVDTEDFSSHPEAFINYLIGKLPFIIFFFLPFFTLFIWLIYIGRPFSYMEHLIFAFHIQTCWFVFYGFAIILEKIIGSDIPTNVANLIFLFYLYKALRNFYRERRFKSMLKFILLNIIFLILAVIAGVISILASFALY